MDSFAVVVPCIILLTHIFGILGLFLAFPTYCIVILIFILITNLIIIKKSKGKYSGLFLTENTPDGINVIDATLSGKENEIAQFTKQLHNFCLTNNIDQKVAIRVAVVCEELSLFIKNSKEHSTVNIDFITDIKDDKISLFFRNSGKPLNIFDTKDEKFCSLEVLKNLVDNIEYDYVLGLNQTKVVINTKSKTKNKI